MASHQTKGVECWGTLCGGEGAKMERLTGAAGGLFKLARLGPRPLAALEHRYGGRRHLEGRVREPFADEHESVSKVVVGGAPWRARWQPKNTALGKATASEAGEDSTRTRRRRCRVGRMAGADGR